MSASRTAAPALSGSSLVSQFVSAYSRMRLHAIGWSVLLVLWFQTRLAFAAPAPTEPPAEPAGLNPPSWCPLPTYNTSEGFMTGVNAATREASGWGIIIGFALVPLIGVGIVLFARDSKLGKKLFGRLKEIGIGMTAIVLGTTALTILFAIIGLMVSAALNGTGIDC